MTWLLVAIGAAVGAPARFLLDSVVRRRFPRRWPLGILVVNLVGCFVLGALTGIGVGVDVGALVGVGFAGTFTTMSSFAWDAVALWTGGDRDMSARYVAMSVAGGFGLAALAATVF